MSSNPATSSNSNSTDDSNLFDKFVKRFISSSDEGIEFDFEFIVGSERVVVKGHRFVFGVSSKVFQAMLYGDLKEGDTVIVEDIHPDGFECMKQFIYTGQINFTSAIQALLTYVAARKYLISVLSTVCSKYLEEKMRPAEVLEFYECCKILNVTEFEELSCRIIREKTEEVVASEYFITAKSETVELILSSSSLRLRSEFEVFDAFERWALAEASRTGIAGENVATSFNNLKKHVRFLTIGSEQFLSRVAESLLLTAEEKLVIGMNQIKVNSKPMPSSLSSESQPRNFITSANVSESYSKINTFIVKIDGSCGSCTEFVFRYDILQLHITCIQSGNCICIELKPIKCTNTSINGYCFLKTKLRILAVNSCDDLYIEKECDFEYVSSVLAQNQKVIIAAIPINKLKKDCFMRSANTLTIEGSFKIQKIS